MYKHIDSDNTSHYKEVELSDFSVVYHKLYLISYLSSTRCIAFNPQKKPAYKGLTPDIIAQIEEEILGIKPSEPDDIDYDEEI